MGVGNSKQMAKRMITLTMTLALLMNSIFSSSSIVFTADGGKSIEAVEESGESGDFNDLLGMLEENGLSYEIVEEAVDEGIAEELYIFESKDEENTDGEKLADEDVLISQQPEADVEDDHVDDENRVNECRDDVCYWTADMNDHDNEVIAVNANGFLANSDGSDHTFIPVEDFVVKNPRMTRLDWMGNATGNITIPTGTWNTNGWNRTGNITIPSGAHLILIPV